MKLRTSFVSNSSSCSFMIKNESNEVKILMDFVNETLYLLNEFREEYGYTEEKYDEEYSEDKFLESAEKDYDSNNVKFGPYEVKYITYGDEDGYLVGKIYDYMLRDYGRSENFSWRLDEMLR